MGEYVIYIVISIVIVVVSGACLCEKDEDVMYINGDDNVADENIENDSDINIEIVDGFSDDDKGFGEDTV